ncbi:MAG: PIG-L family deacetylase [Verrucomicrobia bacterium]|jgi:LmbE family N-acetylglucosaminyl deacetylase|nr:PIG-L family deacetylase [Verrucomicrobiota bacterium]
MNLHHPNHDLLIRRETPSGRPLPRVSHLAIAAHQDDVEIFACHGILECFRREDRNFGAVIVTDGAGSARTGRYSACGDEDMQGIRREEQRQAAAIGDYAFVAQLAYPSARIRESGETDSVDDLVAILEASAPETLYLHNPFDKHATHVAVLGKCLAAMRRLPEEQRPKRIFGCEVWRDLDWLPDARKVALPVDGMPNLRAALLRVFDSQISGGKRYDLAAEGRRMANATFHESHEVDKGDRLTFALDLSPIFHDETADPQNFLDVVINEFRNEVAGNARLLLP